MDSDQRYIRNFAIIAHIDHGKSTLADRLLELTGTVAHRDMQAQLLDSNPIERERGITIKLAPVRMVYHESIEHRALSIENNPSPIHHAPLLCSIHHSPCSDFILNLIDTPGHVDFSYEVSRSLAACEGAILLVDATQGVQAQTLAHLTSARKQGLTIIPVINKIDLPNAQVEDTARQLESLGFAPLARRSFSEGGPTSPSSPSTLTTPLCISAKTGANVEAVLEAVVSHIPAPHGEPDKPLRALVFSSQYDSHKGVVVFVRVVDGMIVSQGFSKLSFKVPQSLALSGKLQFMASGVTVDPVEIGHFTPIQRPQKALFTGEVGYIATGLKDVKLAKVGDTVTIESSSQHTAYRKNFSSHSVNCELSTVHLKPLAGYKEPKPMVFVSLYPVSSDDYQDARQAVERLRLSDSAFTFRPISSAALGNGFHCGFLGLLHAEIVQERLLREFDLSMIATAPSVEYHVTLIKGVDFHKLGFTDSHIVSNQATNHQVTNHHSVSIQSASELPDVTYIDTISEPVMQVTIYTPKAFVGSVMQLAQEKRGVYMDMQYLNNNETIQQSNKVTKEDTDFGNREPNVAMVKLTYLIPLADMIVDFFDRLKSITEGYASLDYEFWDYQPVDVVRVEILLNHEQVDALSFLVVRNQAHARGKEIVERLAAVIPRAQFAIPVQAAIGGAIVARADIRPFRKDVIQKLYGGDRTRKDKLLKKQKRGKERMKTIGKVQIPQQVFFEVLKRN